ncbi:hypothetical protein [Morganella morganii]|uniref:hypothetical protein n=1 Tax=Morganella morganii TaxID=582 RepID=UPI001A22533F|nr:hypothetical protein [Morganella morganii]MCU6224592.1 hypothetical protein [Morganella morganii]MCU6232426.1 hypothetical protein [Morganella morganii]MCU6235806.1 hypothetical protein [Morganella morganii]HAT1525636.1 hypothetical protein [Morganella morganii]HDF2365630.1 hypothetical protein [Morganella morganii]
MFAIPGKTKPEKMRRNRKNFLRDTANKHFVSCRAEKNHLPEKKCGVNKMKRLKRTDITAL